MLGLGQFRGFVGWAVLAGAYFFVMMTRLILTFEARWLRWLLHGLVLTACVSLGYSVLIPYLPEDIPGWARLHVALASGASVLLMTALLVVLLWLRYWPLLWVWVGVTAVCGLLFVTAGMVTTALEVFFTISAALLTRSIWLRRENGLIT